jgi:hypothetical protein
MDLLAAQKNVEGRKGCPNLTRRQRKILPRPSARSRGGGDGTSFLSMPYSPARPSRSARANSMARLTHAGFIAHSRPSCVIDSPPSSSARRKNSLCALDTRGSLDPPKICMTSTTISSRTPSQFLLEGSARSSFAARQISSTKAPLPRIRSSAAFSFSTRRRNTSPTLQRCGSSPPRQFLPSALIPPAEDKCPLQGKRPSSCAECTGPALTGWSAAYRTSSRKWSSSCLGRDPGTSVKCRVVRGSAADRILGYLLFLKPPARRSAGSVSEETLNAAMKPFFTAARPS